MSETIYNIVILVALLVFAGYLGWLLAKAGGIHTPFDQKSLSSDRVGELKGEARSRAITDAAAAVAESDALRQIAVKDRQDGASGDPLEGPSRSAIEALIRDTSGAERFSADELTQSSREHLVSEYLLAWYGDSEDDEGEETP